MTERDGSFRRLSQTVKRQSARQVKRQGRPRKDRVMMTGSLSVAIHDRMKALARARSRYSEQTVSVSDVYNEAAQGFLADLHFLLGDDLRLPSGVISVEGILGLRELISRPIVTPLSELSLEGEGLSTTLSFDRPVWEALRDLTLLVSLHLRRAHPALRLLEVAAVWYLTSFDKPPEE